MHWCSQNCKHIGNRCYIWDFLFHSFQLTLTISYTNPTGIIQCTVSVITEPTATYSTVLEQTFNVQFVPVTRIGSKKKHVTKMFSCVLVGIVSDKSRAKRKSRLFSRCRSESGYSQWKLSEVNHHYPVRHIRLTASFALVRRLLLFVKQHKMEIVVEQALHRFCSARTQNLFVDWSKYLSIDRRLRFSQLKNMESR